MNICRAAKIAGVDGKIRRAATGEVVILRSGSMCCYERSKWGEVGFMPNIADLTAYDWVPVLPVETVGEAVGAGTEETT